jgi:predicted HTH transcriptional regulator
MANTQDGGLVVIGVEDKAGVLNPVGVAQSDLLTWKHDDLTAGIAAFADPFVSFEQEIRTHDGKQFLLLEIREFEEIPVLCRKGYRNNNQDILRSGACYVRTRRKPETSEIPSQTEMRELLDLSLKKGLRKFMGQALASGLVTAAAPVQQPSDAERYANQSRDLLT